jgi:hypothetical protein
MSEKKKPSPDDTSSQPEEETTPEEEQPVSPKKRIELRGQINLDRFRALMEKAGGDCTLQIAVKPPSEGDDSATTGVVRNEQEE